MERTLYEFLGRWGLATLEKECDKYVAYLNGDKVKDFSDMRIALLYMFERENL